MTIFNNTELAALKADPTTIAALWAAHSVFFNGLFGAGAQGAFCCVLAYEYVPYGNGTSGVMDLAGCLNETSMACAERVTFTWQLMAELGMDTTKQQALGWNGGAVGNHCQMIAVDPNGRSWLLDPTIGYIVPDVSVASLQSGVHTPVGQSFYHSDPILDGANSNLVVRNAVANGAYRVQDTIFDTHSLSAWLTGGDSYGLGYTSPSGARVDWLTSDVMIGTSGIDTLYGNDGNDSIYGGAGGTGDVLDGMAGDDVLISGAGSSYMYGGAGNDYFYGENASLAEAFGGAGTDVIVGSTRSGATNWDDGGAGTNYYFGAPQAINNYILDSTEASQEYQVIQNTIGAHDALILYHTGLQSFGDLLNHSYQNGAYFVVQPDVNHAVWIDGESAGSLNPNQVSIIS